MSRIRELDGLRAIAILGVFLAHFTPAGWGIFDLLYLGWSGVDLFFAISGFLITSILIGLRGQDASFKIFYWRRTLRILPPYYLVLILILVLALLRREQMPYSIVVRYWLFLSSVTPGLIKLAVSRLFFHTHPVFSAYHRATKYYIPGFKDCIGIYWSLSVEELFYLIWAPVTSRVRAAWWCSARLRRSCFARYCGVWHIRLPRLAKLWVSSFVSTLWQPGDVSLFCFVPPERAILNNGP
jgi:peptidoglycan/LPS O-acetylase OafA/YrhL